MKFTSPLLLALLASAVPAFAGVSIGSPSKGADVVSPFNLSATAVACSSQKVSAMGYSLDNSSSTTIVYGTAVNASVTSATGVHTLHVKAWGNRGASCVTSIVVNVVVPAPAYSVAAQSVTVMTPANHASVTSPFQLTAEAPTCSNQTVAAMGYSFDSSSDTTVVRGRSIAAIVASGAGAHTLHVKAWGNKGAACVTDVALSVTAPATAATIPDHAISVSSLQIMNNWKADRDVATGSGSASGIMQLVTSPSRSGTARKFSTSYTKYGGERYYLSFGDDSSSTNFLYDAWVYLDSSVNQIANLELDMNQTMANGQTVIYGFQCDGWTGTWDYTANKGTPEAPVDAWIHSSAPCNVRKWSINSWHHVQISYSRDDSGNVTYKSVWLDDVRQDINATVPSAFALGWGPSLLTNFQIDGSGAVGQPTAYLDNLTIYRW